MPDFRMKWMKGQIPKTGKNIRPRMFFMYLRMPVGIQLSCHGGYIAYSIHMFCALHKVKSVNYIAVSDDVFFPGYTFDPEDSRDEDNADNRPSGKGIRRVAAPEGS